MKGGWLFIHHLGRLALGKRRKVVIPLALRKMGPFSSTRGGKELPVVCQSRSTAATHVGRESCSMEHSSYRVTKLAKPSCLITVAH